MSRKIAVVGLVLSAGVLLLLWGPWGEGDRGSSGDAAASSEEGQLSVTPRAPLGAAKRHGRPRSRGAATPGAIRGTVQRSSARRGVAGAELTWLDATGEPPEELAQTRSDAKGHFSVALEAGSYRMRVKAPGYLLPEEAPLLRVMPDARAEAWIIPAQRKSVLRGEVVDGEGRALARIQVGLAGVWRGGRWMKRRPERGAVISAADGSFALLVPPGVLRVAMRVGKRWILSPTLLIPAEREVSGLRLVARADASFTGQVLGPKGARVANASVLLDDLTGQREVRCDEDGRFEVRDLSAGELLLMPRAAGMAARSISRLQLKRGRPGRVVLQLQPTRRQAGRVVGRDGAGIGGARIALQILTPAGVAQQLIMPKSLRSAADGRFTLELDARPRVIMASAPGPLRGYRRGIVPQAGELVLPLRAPGQIAGRIRSKGGKPLGFVRLTIEEGGQRQRLWLITGKGGRFRLSGLMPGTVRVDVEADSLASKRSLVAVRSGSTTSLDLRLEAAGGVTGFVRDAAGAPLAGVEAQVERHPARAVSDFEGRFVLSGLAVGVYTLVLAHPEQRTKRIEKVRVGAGGVVSVSTIALQPLSSRPREVWRPPSVRDLPQKDD